MDRQETVSFFRDVVMIAGATNVLFAVFIYWMTVETWPTFACLGSFLIATALALTPSFRSLVRTVLRRARFSLRFLLVIVMLASLPLAWVSHRLHLSRPMTQAELQALERINHSGIAIAKSCEYGFPDGTFFFVQLDSGVVDIDEKLADLVADLHSFRRLALYANSTTLSDSGLMTLSALDNLREIYVERSSVTDMGIQALLQAIPRCKVADQYRFPQGLHCSPSIESRN